MAKRVRITQRNRRAVDDSVQYPGNVNQPDRKFKRHDQYDSYQETLNHPIPDMRHEWQDDERDEIGFGIPEAWGAQPTNASIRVAANKSVKLAVLLLGEKVDEETIEMQANDFMLLGPEALDRSLARFAKTQELYAEDDEEVAEEKAVEAAEEEEAEEEVVEASKAPKKAAGKTKASEELAEKAAEEVATEDTGAAEVEASEDEEVAEEKAVEAAEEEEAEEKTSETSDKTAADEEEEVEDEEEVVEASSKSVASMDIELSSSIDDGAMSEGESDERLAGLFGDNIPEELPEPGTGRREASSKKGIKTLGGQPRVASNGGGGQDISSLWGETPDVSDVFR